MKLAFLKNNKWVRRALLTVLGVFVLWLLAWLTVPPLLKSQLEKIASEKLGRQVSVGRVDFKPWTLELTLEDLRIASARGGEPQLQVRRLYADAELQSVLRLAPVIDAVKVEAPHLRITRMADASLDFADILDRLAKEPVEPKSEPARFAIYNISITDGAVDADDRTVNRKHELRGLVLNLPFLSNFESKREVKIEPRLAFALNGVPFDSNAQSTPFAQSRKTDLRLHFTGLDLKPYLGYIPAKQPVKPQSGTLDADLRVDFERGPTEGLRISGTVQAHQARLADARGQELFGFDALKIGLQNVRPLEGLVHLSEVSLDRPQIDITRNAEGKLNVLQAMETPPEEQPARPVIEAAGRAIKKQVWRVQVDKLGVRSGELNWRDETLRPAAAVQATPFEVQANAVSWPMEKPVAFNGALTVSGGTLQFKGEATDKAATVQTQLDALPLSVAAPYLAQFLEPTLNGKLGAQIDVIWAQPDLKIKARQVQADGLALVHGKETLASIGHFELTDSDVDLTAHKIVVGGLKVNDPKLRVERNKEQRWMYERWLKHRPAAGAGTAHAGGDGAKPWNVSINSAGVDGGVVSFVDNAGATAVEAEITQFKLRARNIVPGGSAAMPLELSGRIGAGRADPGRFAYKGQLGLKPVSVGGEFELNAIPVHAFKAYFADTMPNIDLRRAFLNYKGQLRYTQESGGPRVRLEGDTAVEDLRVNSASPAQRPSTGLERGNQLLTWKTLALRGVRFSLAPHSPMALDVRETSLTDFFARILIDETGRLRLQDYASRTPVEASPEAAPADASATRHVAGTTVTTSKAPVQTEGAPTAPADSTPADAAARPAIQFGPITLVNGRIDFNDRFIKPNYSADISALTGRLSAFSSQPKPGQPLLADMELRGQVQQTASLEILGKLNPLVKPLELDITAKMRGLELAPLSPYSARYAGHGIERGKLSADLNYKVTPDGSLTATNKLVLNQLAFGDKVPNAERTLPVRLAVALLADRNGVIDVDLPLSGSINDPQFRLGPLIWKGILNLITKALTAPFSLLTGGLGGGSDESNTIVFAPGNATLDAAAKESLDKLVKALTDRPTLKMTIIGTASLDQERAAYQRERVRQLLFAEKRRIANRAGKDVAEVEPVTDAEYPELLRAVYKRADISKPRNMIGLPQDLPVKEMEDLLMANVQVNDESIHQLAVARGVAVRDYLLARQLSGDRLFLGAVQTKPEGDKWKPGAELKLDMT